MLHAAQLRQTVDGRDHGLRLEAQQLGRCRNELVLREKGMSVCEIVAQLKNNARFDAAGVVAVKAELQRKLIGCAEAPATHTSAAPSIQNRSMDLFNMERV